MSVKYIFIDLDGPILEGKFRQYNCYKDLVEQHGGKSINIDEYWNLKRNRFTRQDILKKSKYEESDEYFLEEWLKNIERKKYLYFDKLKPNVGDVLTSWSNMGYRVVLVTMRKNRENLLWQLDNLGLLNKFYKIISCPFTGLNAKYEAVKHIKFDKAIFIGDTEEDINTARLFGVKVIAIITGVREKKYLEADYYYNEIEDIEISNINI